MQIHRFLAKKHLLLGILRAFSLVFIFQINFPVLVVYGDIHVWSSDDAFADSNASDNGDNVYSTTQTIQRMGTNMKK